MSSFLSNIEFAADNILYCLSNAENLDRFSELYYSGSAVINVNIKPS